MAQGGDSGGEKSFEPTPQKLAEARRKGDVPRSMNASAAAGFIGIFIALTVAGQSGIQDVGTVLASFIANSDTLTGKVLAPGGGIFFQKIANEVFSGLSTIFLLPFGAAAAALIAQQAFVLSTDKLVPKASRLNPLANAKQKFGITGLVQFAQNLIKMGAVTVAFSMYLTSRSEELIGIVRGTPGAAVGLLGEMLIALFSIACVIFGAIGLIDVLWQRFDHARKLRMTHEEIKEEHKRTEGDPQLKQMRRQKAEALATNRMLQDVADADVIIVNPTHFAVALKWSRAQGSAPVCVAKGVDEIAARIREIGAEAGVPIQRDPPTARVLYDTVEIGDEIQPEHYRAVAAAIRFAERIRQRMRGAR